MGVAAMLVMILRNVDTVYPHTVVHVWRVSVCCAVGAVRVGCRHAPQLLTHCALRPDGYRVGGVMWAALCAAAICWQQLYQLAGTQGNGLSY